MVGIICFWDREATPYLEKYERLLESKCVDYEVIFWNRTGVKSDQLDSKEREFVHKCRTNVIHKIIDFISWRKKIIKTLKEENYDFLIILSTYPAILLSSYIFKHYKQKYIFDIRDYTMEQNPLFGYLVTKLIDKSMFTTISSKGFMKWLKPSNKIIPNHNITIIDDNYIKNISLKTSDKLNFTFVGNVRLYTHTKAVLLNLKNSKKYISGFVGRIMPSCNIKQLCRYENITNVHFGEQFPNKDKPEIYSNIDLINAIYGDEYYKLVIETALPNKLYDAAVFKCPIVASKGTYLAELIDEYYLGFSVNGFDHDIEKQFDSFINSFDEKAFREGCERFLRDIMDEEEIFLTRLNSTLDTLR